MAMTTVADDGYVSQLHPRGHCERSLRSGLFAEKRNLPDEYESASWPKIVVAMTAVADDGYVSQLHPRGHSERSLRSEAIGSLYMGLLRQKDDSQ